MTSNQLARGPQISKSVPTVPIGAVCEVIVSHYTCFICPCFPCSQQQVVIWDPIRLAQILGFLMSFLGCIDGNTGVCVTGLTFASIFVCALVGHLASKSHFLCFGNIGHGALKRVL